MSRDGWNRTISIAALLYLSHFYKCPWISYPVIYRVTDHLIYILEGRQHIELLLSLGRNSHAQLLGHMHVLPELQLRASLIQIPVRSTHAVNS